MKTYIDANRTLTTPFDIVVEGNTIGLTHTQKIDKQQPWIEAGATWWIETRGDVPQDQVLAHIRQGPPRLE